jgi:hypothetical protein
LKIDNLRLHAFFFKNGITHLHHANSIASSTSFIEAGGLLSRGDMERSGLFQTVQDSDDADKECDVWDDVFVDTADLHGLFPRQNLYGPVLFKFNIDFLLKDEVDIWITKNNPMYWDDGLSNDEKYFQGIDDLIAHWDDFEKQRKMVTIRKPCRPVLFKSLVELLLDDPRVKIYNTTTPLTEAKSALYKCTENEIQLRELMTIRECSWCFCQDNYLKQVSTEQVARLFLPKGHEHFPD